MDNECSRPAGKPQDSSRDAATRPARKLLDTTGWKDCHQTIKFVKKNQEAETRNWAGGSSSNSSNSSLARGYRTQRKTSTKPDLNCKGSFEAHSSYKRAFLRIIPSLILTLNPLTKELVKCITLNLFAIMLMNNGDVTMHKNKLFFPSISFNIKNIEECFT